MQGGLLARILSSERILHHGKQHFSPLLHKMHTAGLLSLNETGSNGPFGILHPNILEKNKEKLWHMILSSYYE